MAASHLGRRSGIPPTALEAGVPCRRYDGYESHLLITREYGYLQEQAFQGFRKISVEECRNVQIPDSFKVGKTWQDGIARDLLMIDPGLTVAYAVDPMDRSVWNNILICFGLHFFASEICIRTDPYVSHVLSNYYSDKSIAYMSDTIHALRRNGIEYWNPYTNSVSMNEKEKTRKERILLKGLDPGEIIKRPEIFPGIKILKEREAHPAYISEVRYSKQRKRYW